MTPDEIRAIRPPSLSAADFVQSPELVQGMVQYDTFLLLLELTAQLAEIKDLLKERKG